MTLKELLGTDYREDLTLTDIDNLLASKKLVDISKGEYVNRDKAEREKNEAINAVKAEYDKKIGDYESNVNGLNEKISKLENEKNDSVFLEKVKSHNIDEKYLDYVKAKYQLDDKIDDNLTKFAEENPAFLKEGTKITFPNLEKKKEETKENLTLNEALFEHYSK